jgi:hypothetical protein
VLSRFVNRVRGGVSVFVGLAFFYSQMSAATVRLVPGAPLPQEPPQQQSTVPAQPGEVQQQQQPQPTAPAPPNEGQTTVVQVPVPKENTLDITVIEGEGASNVIGKKSSVKPMVEVRDEKNQLLEGAVVTFIAPADGPSIVFSNGLRTVTVMTDAQGRARTPSVRAVNDGPFRLQVSASFRGQMVSTSISQTNFESAAEANGKGSAATPGDHPVVNKKSAGGLSGTTWAIILGAGAAAAVGIGVGLGHKGSSSSTTTTTSATIGGPGSPTVGAP